MGSDPNTSHIGNGREHKIKIEDKDENMEEVPTLAEGKALKSECLPEVKDELEAFVKEENGEGLHPSSLDNSSDLQQTIYALSTGAGSAAIAVIRISGPACQQVCCRIRENALPNYLQIYNSLCPNKPIGSNRCAVVRTLYHPADSSNVLDSEAMVLRFDKPNTATGEDMLELHVHGGAATVKAVMSAIPQVANPFIRAAGPGEFTRRAFTNGKLDLAQIESLSDTLAAQTEQQRRAALGGHSGRLSLVYKTLQTDLQNQRAELVADVDFGEDQSLEGLDNIWRKVIKDIVLLQSRIVNHQMAARCGEMLRKGIKVSLVGVPNVGKSSLFNFIVGKNASIVNQQAGTTRDIVEATIDFDGFLCTFSDTAGVREGFVNDIEKEGIERAIAQAKEADIILYVLAAEPLSEHVRTGWEIHYSKELQHTVKEQNGLRKPVIVIANKKDNVPSEYIDRWKAGIRQDIRQTFPRPDLVSILPISVSNARHALEYGNNVPDPGNMNAFKDLLISYLKGMTRVSPEMEDLVGTTERQSQLLEECNEHLGTFVHYAEGNGESSPDAAIAISHLDNAAVCLAKITGRDTTGMVGDVEEILGVIFEKYVLRVDK